jgi:CubicO group peptidase (beta-lactamase class C family)
MVATMQLKHFMGALAGSLVFATATAGSAAKTPSYPDADASDPARLGWMVGSPPPPDRMLRFEDGSYFQFPALRWSVSHFRQLMPTVNVSRGLAPAVPLPQAPREDIDELRFTPLGASQSMTWRDSLKANYTDGIVVLHKGRVVYERYFGVLKPEGQHGAMSVTKSFVGTLAAVMAAEGQLDPSRRVAEYVPELAASAFGNATVRQLMDMTTGIRFSEDYADPQAEVWAHAAAGNPRACTARPSATARPTPMLWGGCWRASAANRWPTCCPNASGAAWAPSRTPICRWIPRARRLRAAASTWACAIWRASGR